MLIKLSSILGLMFLMGATAQAQADATTPEGLRIVREAPPSIGIRGRTGNNANTATTSSNNGNAASDQTAQPQEKDQYNP